MVPVHINKIKWDSNETHFTKILPIIIGVTCRGFANHAATGAVKGKRAKNKANNAAPPAKPSTQIHGPQAHVKKADSGGGSVSSRVSIAKKQKKQTHRQAMTMRNIHPPPRPASVVVVVEDQREDGVVILD